MKVSVAEANSRLDELGNKFSLLQEKVQRNSDQSFVSAGPADDIEQSSRPAYLEDFATLEGLKVESLREDAEPISVESAAKDNKKGKSKKKKAANGGLKSDAPDDKGASLADSGNPGAVYAGGQDLFLAGRYEDARTVFLTFLEKFPSHKLAVNAIYWTGETFYSEKSFEKALEEFKSVVERYPKSVKAPDALLKVGYTYIELDKKDLARDSLEEVVKNYPRSEASAKAKKTLEKISGVKKEGSK